MRGGAAVTVIGRHLGDATRTALECRFGAGRSRAERLAHDARAALNLSSPEDAMSCPAPAARYAGLAFGSVDGWPLPNLTGVWTDDSGRTVHVCTLDGGFAASMRTDKTAAVGLWDEQHLGYVGMWQQWRDTYDEALAFGSIDALPLADTSRRHMAGFFKWSADRVSVGAAIAVVEAEAAAAASAGAAAEAPPSNATTDVALARLLARLYPRRIEGAWSVDGAARHFGDAAAGSNHAHGDWILNYMEPLPPDAIECSWLHRRASSTASPAASPAPSQSATSGGVVAEPPSAPPTDRELDLAPLSSIAAALGVHLGFVPFGHAALTHGHLGATLRPRQYYRLTAAAPAQLGAVFWAPPPLLAPHGGCSERLSLRASLFIGGGVGPDGGGDGLSIVVGNFTSGELLHRLSRADANDGAHHGADGPLVLRLSRVSLAIEAFELRLRGASVWRAELSGIAERWVDVHLVLLDGGAALNLAIDGRPQLVGFRPPGAPWTLPLQVRTLPPFPDPPRSVGLASHNYRPAASNNSPPPQSSSWRALPDFTHLPRPYLTELPPQSERSPAPISRAPQWRVGAAASTIAFTDVHAVAGARGSCGDAALVNVPFTITTEGFHPQQPSTLSSSLEPPARGSGGVAVYEPVPAAASPLPSAASSPRASAAPAFAAAPVNASSSAPRAPLEYPSSGWRPHPVLEHVAFRYYAEPRLEAAVPALGHVSGGALVTVNGTGLPFGHGYWCAFGEADTDWAWAADGLLAARFSAATWHHATQVVSCRAPSVPYASAVALRVSLNAQQFSVAFVNYTFHAPAISAYAPASGPVAGGTTLVVEGSDLRVGPMQPLARCVVNGTMQTDATYVAATLALPQPLPLLRAFAPCRACTCRYVEAEGVLQCKSPVVPPALATTSASVPFAISLNGQVSTLEERSLPRSPALWSPSSAVACSHRSSVGISPHPPLACPRHYPSPPLSGAHIRAAPVLPHRRGRPASPRAAVAAALRIGWRPRLRRRHPDPLPHARRHPCRPGQRHPRGRGL